ncbi:MAG: hypothetical protein LBO79_10745 [Zoogloeaceae bacterium]|nr:hypothetical protein [Zoogloeaceae bacterium]
MNEPDAVIVSSAAFTGLHAAVCRVLRQASTKNLQHLADALIAFDEEALPFVAGAMEDDLAAEGGGPCAF